MSEEASRMILDRTDREVSTGKTQEKKHEEGWHSDLKDEVWLDDITPPAAHEN